MTLRRTRYSFEEAADILNISAKSLENLAIDGHVKLVARSNRVADFRRLSADCVSEVLAADKRVEASFNFTAVDRKQFRHFRGESPTQRISRASLFIEAAEIERLQESPDLVNLRKVRTKKIQTKEKPRHNGLSKRGKHWKENRDVILTAAKEILEQDRARFVKGSGEVNIRRLSLEVNDQRHRWPTLKDDAYGTSLRKIEEALLQFRKDGILN